jgi:hypothetical protein
MIHRRWISSTHRPDARRPTLARIRAVLAPDLVARRVLVLLAMPPLSISDAIIRLQRAVTDDAVPQGIGRKLIDMAQDPVRYKDAAAIPYLPGVPEDEIAHVWHRASVNPPGTGYGTVRLPQGVCSWTSLEIRVGVNTDADAITRAAVATRTMHELLSTIDIDKQDGGITLAELIDFAATRYAALEPEQREAFDRLVAYLEDPVRFGDIARNHYGDILINRGVGRVPEHHVVSRAEKFDVFELAAPPLKVVGRLDHLDDEVLSKIYWPLRFVQDRSAKLVVVAHIQGLQRGEANARVTPEALAKIRSELAEARAHWMRRANYDALTAPGEPFNRADPQRVEAEIARIRGQVIGPIENAQREIDVLAASLPTLQSRWLGPRNHAYGMITYQGRWDQLRHFKGYYEPDVYGRAALRNMPAGASAAIRHARTRLLDRPIESVVWDLRLAANAEARQKLLSEVRADLGELDIGDARPSLDEIDGTIQRFAAPIVERYEGSGHRYVDLEYWRRLVRVEGMTYAERAAMP